jgi:rubrerythrin
MALIDTALSYDCDNNLRMAIVEELGATKSYRELREKIYIADSFPAGVKEELLRRLNEIIKDEENHIGSLLFCLNLINPDASKNMNDGANGG